MSSPLEKLTSHIQLHFVHFVMTALAPSLRNGQSGVRDGQVVRAGSEASPARRSARSAVRRRLHFVLSVQGGRGESAGSAEKAIRQIRAHAPSREDQAHRVWPVGGGESGETGRKAAGDVRL